MLPKKNRLKKKKDFENIFKGGKGYKEDFLYLKIIKNNLKSSRFGFIVGKNFSKKAAVRNRIRRQLRELIKNNLSKITSGIDGVIIVRPGLQITDFWDLEEKVVNLLKKSKLIS